MDKNEIRESMRAMEPLDRHAYEIVPDPRLLILDLKRCIEQGTAPQAWVVDALADTLPKGTDGRGRGKPTINEMIAGFAADTVRFKAVLDAKERGVPHRECFQAASDELAENSALSWAHGSDATMKRAYYRIVRQSKDASDKV